MPFECIALLLQGGGALGAYQAGVYEALAVAGLHPDWVAGISIGAINAALIAGNAPDGRVAKLRRFWERVTADPIPGGFCLSLATTSCGNWTQPVAIRLCAPSRCAWLLLAARCAAIPCSAGTAEATSFYDTSALREHA